MPPDPPEIMRIAPAEILPVRKIQAPAAHAMTIPIPDVQAMAIPIPEILIQAALVMAIPVPARNIRDLDITTGKSMNKLHECCVPIAINL